MISPIRTRALVFGEWPDRGHFVGWSAEYIPNQHQCHFVRVNRFRWACNPSESESCGEISALLPASFEKAVEFLQTLKVSGLIFQQAHDLLTGRQIRINASLCVFFVPILDSISGANELLPQSRQLVFNARQLTLCVLALNVHAAYFFVLFIEMDPENWTVR